jgi:DNA-binding HxlR family transcriptional regulator
MTQAQTENVQSSEARKDNGAAETRQKLYETTVRSDARCVVERTAEVIGGKWTTLILRDLLRGTRRFGELRAALGSVSPKTLTDRLRELERSGLVTRTVYPEVPPRVEYTLTPKGEALRPVVDAMAAWGAEWT